MNTCIRYGSRSFQTQSHLATFGGSDLAASMEVERCKICIADLILNVPVQLTWVDHLVLHWPMQRMQSFAKFQMGEDETLSISTQCPVAKSHRPG